MIRKEINLHQAAVLAVVQTLLMQKAAFLRKAATMITKRKSPHINAAGAEMHGPLIVATNPPSSKEIAQTQETRESTDRNLTVEIGRGDEEQYHKQKSLIKFKVKLSWNLNGVLVVFCHRGVRVARSRDTL